MCTHSCFRRLAYVEKPCAECLKEIAADDADQNDFAVLCAGDPAREGGHEYATEGEARARLEATTTTAG